MMNSTEQALAASIHEQPSVRNYSDPKVSSADDGTVRVTVPFDPDSQMNRPVDVENLTAAMAGLGYVPASEVEVEDTFPFGICVRGRFRRV